MIGEHVIRQPWWWEEAPRPDPEEISLPPAVDVLVVGSGYTGLSAALTAARAGRSVLVCEAEVPGFGASSRNGGGVGTMPYKIGFEATASMLGRDRARRLWREGKASVEHMAELIETEQIPCHFARTGRFIGAHRKGDMDGIRREAEILGREVGAEIDVVERRDQQAEIGTELYHGGRFNRADGVVHPGLYHLGLLDRTRSAGAEIAAGTRVKGIERSEAGLVVTTSRGKVRAGAVALGTNGYTGDAEPWLQRRVIPVSSQIIATEELDPAVVRRLLPKGNMIVDTKRTVNYYRASPDGRRILMGGRPALRDVEWHVSASRLRDFMVKVFPELEETRITHAWGGKLGFTFDKLPHIGEHDGVHYAAGYLGSGVAMSTWLGHKMGLRIVGDPAGETALDGRDFPTLPLYSGNPWFLAVVAAYYRVRDAIG